jgi:hypothetical protein
MVNSLFNDGKSIDALSFAERAKARVLLDVLKSGRTPVWQCCQHATAPEDVSVLAKD